MGVGLPYDFLTTEEREALKPDIVAERGSLRRLRVFISHRWEQHKADYREVQKQLSEKFGKVQDLSITSDRQLKGPRGGNLEQLQLMSEMAARIFSSDIIISPSNVGMGRSRHTQFEIQTAAVAYSVPIIFLRQRGQIRSAAFVRQAERLGIRHSVADFENGELISAVQSFVTKDTLLKRVPVERLATEFAHRGPDPSTLHSVLTNHPYFQFEGTMDAFTTSQEMKNQSGRRRRRWRWWGH